MQWREDREGGSDVPVSLTSEATDASLDASRSLLRSGVVGTVAEFFLFFGGILRMARVLCDEVWKVFL